MNLDKSLSTPLTFLWWFLTELSLFSSFANDDDYLIVRLLEALSWIRFSSIIELSAYNEASILEHRIQIVTQ